MMTDFERGWHWGRANQKELTVREVEALGVEDVVSFINGMIDGNLNDDWRLKIIRQAEQAASEGR